ncbi:MAG TPA: hypothetical protein VJM12_20850 [Pyrinomonadaceae bacterium]|nr:hypothetical protein [Pyrinomonadaceae bacterium]
MRKPRLEMRKSVSPGCRGTGGLLYRLGQRTYSNGLGFDGRKV